MSEDAVTTPGPVALDYEYSKMNGERQGWVSTIGWAIYLGMSWTWCIGMFLPVLLVRDFGIWGWIVFAVPNVAGAAAMGWTISSAGQSRAMVDAHRGMMIAFSFVTAAFQIFFAMWMIRILSDDGAHTVLAAALMLVVILMLRGAGAARWAAFVALAVSSVCAIRLWQIGIFSYWGEFGPLRHGTPSIGLALVCLLGFGLCPYLDLTFHRARQALNRREAQAAFGIGFGAFFFSMLIFSLGYSLLMILVLANFGYAPTILWLGLHFGVQLALTIGFHWYEGSISGGWNSGRLLFVCVLSTFIGIGAAFLARHISWGRMNSGELIYRLFMSFYGLVFPAYAWICMIPSWRAPVPPTRAMWIVLAGAVVAAAPFYWAGFIGNRMIWVVPGVLIVLASRMFVRMPKIG